MQEHSQQRIQKLLRKFAKGHLTKAEEVELKRIAASDPFVADAIEGLDQPGEHAEHISAIRQFVERNQQKQRRQIWQYSGAAAAMLVLIVAGFLIISRNVDPTLNSTQTAMESEEDTREAVEPDFQIVGESEHEVQAGDAKNLNSPENTSNTEKEEGRAEYREKGSENKGANNTTSPDNPTDGSPARVEQSTPSESIIDERTLREQSESMATYNLELEDGPVHHLMKKRNSRDSRGEQTDPDTGEDLTPNVAGGSSDAKLSSSAILMEESGNALTVMPKEGWAKFETYLYHNMQIPGSDTTKADSLIVRLEFKVNKEGRPVDFAIKRSPGEDFSKEAIRLLEEGPDWLMQNQELTPGMLIELDFKSKEVIHH